jgi:hypothetical protein
MIFLSRSVRAVDTWGDIFGLNVLNCCFRAEAKDYICQVVSGDQASAISSSRTLSRASSRL